MTALRSLCPSFPRPSVHSSRARAAHHPPYRAIHGVRLRADAAAGRGVLSKRHALPAWALAAALGIWAAPVVAQVVGTDLWVTDGPVTSVVRDGNTI